MTTFNRTGPGRQPPGAPLHIRKNTTYTNIVPVRRIRLLRGAQIRARQMFATIDYSGSNTNVVTMPYAGNMSITILNADPLGETVFISCPFLSANTTFTLNSSPAGPSATLTRPNPGLLRLFLHTDGVYVISVGERNDQ